MRATCVHRGGGGQKWPKNSVRTYSMPPKVKGGMIIQTQEEEKAHFVLSCDGRMNMIFLNPCTLTLPICTWTLCISSTLRKVFQFGSEPYIPKGSSRGNFPPQCISHNSVLCHCFVFVLTNSNLIVDVVHMWQLQFKSNIKCHIQLGQLPSPQSLVML